MTGPFRDEPIQRAESDRSRSIPPERDYEIHDLISLWRAMRQEITDSRDLLRDEIAAGHEVLTDRMNAMEKSQREQAVVHAQQHLEDEQERKVWYEKLQTWMRAEELAKARREGLLGGVRFIANVVGNNWRGILAVGAVIAAMLGNIHIDLGTR